MVYVSYRTTEGRFWPKVSVGGPDECWPWTRAVRDGGYGLFYVSKDRGYGPAHRIAWELTHGAIPDGLLVCHRCDNPPCCNPAHLFLGTQSDNMRDAWDKGRMSTPTLRPGFTRQTHCRRGHVMDEANQLREGTRYRCRACVVEKARRYRARRRAS